MFSVRAQLTYMATGLVALVLAAIPVTFTFASAYSNYSMMPYDPYYQPQYNNQYQYGQQYHSQQQYQLYWCNGYYSYSPCPTYHYPTYPKYPKHSYYYYPQYYYPQYSYSYGYNYSYNYNYNYGGYWW